jgi:hypothetical protein
MRGTAILCLPASFLATASERQLRVEAAQDCLRARKAGHSNLVRCALVILRFLYMEQC